MKTISTLLLCCAGLISTSVAKEIKVNSAEGAITMYYKITPLKKDVGSWLRYCPIKINEIDSFIMVDSGADSTTLNAQFAKKNKIKLRQHGFVGGLGNSKARSYKGKVDSFSIGKYLKLPARNYMFVDLGKKFLLILLL